jgi:predicted nuclease of predicted toxin-antitoxin system
MMRSGPSARSEGGVDHQGSRLRNLAYRKTSCPTIIWLRFGNCDTNSLIERVTGSLDQIAAAVERGESMIEVVPR